jgi:integrase
MHNEAVKQGLIPESPFKNLNNLKVDPVDYNIFTQEQMARLLAVNQDSEFYEVYVMLLYTGCRKGELAGLKFDCLDFRNNQICIKRIRDRHGLRETTKSKRIRYIPIHPTLKTILMSLIQQQRNSEYVLATREGKPIDPNHLGRHWKKAQIKAGILPQITVYESRHNFCSHFVMNSGSIFDLQKIVGHANISETMRYSHYSPDHLQNAINFAELRTNCPKSNHAH